MDAPLRCLPALCAFSLATVVAAQDRSTVPSDRGHPRNSISPGASAAIAAALPKFQPPPPPPEFASPILKRPGQEPADDVVHLPRFVVRDRAMPTTEVADKHAFERQVMEQYLGPKNGVDRGVLNVVTIAQLWKKIPVLGVLGPAPFNSVTNEERATRLYKEAEMHEFNELLAISPRSGTAKQTKAGGELKVSPADGSH